MSSLKSITFFISKPPPSSSEQRGMCGLQDEAGKAAVILRILKPPPLWKERAAV
ncbi:hypothetical protein AB434_2905 [Heyndrickxia coagulans]|uniref:Uncharacterized protein n=1 Tax=Heyndrickxia coagulans TaxID=1398 RepID=A0AAN0T7S3_HEYCO|nr:hypothetical protein SB48_HM08orf03780 [Heyndrickxia coagulans]AKN55310.1 hypothetical protein AB434_2905 [Heyndrickxia coagulans]